ncbi:MAG: ribonuclease J [Acidimicrobiaceae bacterium]|jgi:ribonuclease J|nr:ribonuclease J [Acidimicrobiaceae bacterium]|tara:strand:- start:11227 stop:12882 length:1656 start_codon:yes stop_codon:yes gene_type:complete
MKSPVTLTFLGGLGQIGRNCAALETENRIILLDCGQMFPDNLPGVDAILPDFSWVLERSNQVEGCIITHAHEDHIGGLPYLLKEADIPIYGSRFTLGMIQSKLDYAGIRGVKTFELNDYDQKTIGPFDCEFLPVTHSTPSGLMTIFNTPQGAIVHSSDFKLDPTPIDGRVTDLARLKEISQKSGIRLLLADSTNAGSSGKTSSESEIGPVLDKIFSDHENQRIIVAAFSSHIHRIQQIADTAKNAGRTLVILGPSMQRNVTLARELGLLKISDRMISSPEDIETLDHKKICIVCTGSQGEQRAALAQLADNTHRQVTIGEDDTVVFSSHPIPGNEAAVSKLHNDLALLGAQIVHSGQFEVHTSGHGKREELIELHQSVGAEFFIPVHGEYTHLLDHHKLAIENGTDEKNVMLCTDGDQVCLTEEGLEKIQRVSDRKVMVDHQGECVSEELLKERVSLIGDGFVFVRVVIDRESGTLFQDPVVESRGWVEPEDRETWTKEVSKAVVSAVQTSLAGGERDLSQISRQVRRATGQLVSERTGRRPVLIPVVEEP